jgi:hypothetical protein
MPTHGDRGRHRARLRSPRTILRSLQGDVRRELVDNTQDLTAPPLRRRIPTALECLDSPGLAQSIKISVLPAAAATFAGLGRWEDALQITETDFGPMIEIQRRALRAYQLTALALILNQLGRLGRFDHVAGLAMTQQSATDGLTVHAHLAGVVGGDDSLAALPTPATADLTATRIDALIDAVIAETRDYIDTGTAGPLSETAP